MTDSGGVRVLFDENFGRPIVSDFRQLVRWDKRVASIAHLFDFMPAGTADEQWLPMAADKGFLIVSSDVGRGQRGSRLPEICAALGVTHVLISGKLHAQRQFEKMRAILVVWPDLLLVAQEHTGQRFLLQKGQKNPVLLRKS